MQPLIRYISIQLTSSLCNEIKQGGVIFLENSNKRGQNREHHSSLCYFHNRVSLAAALSAPLLHFALQWVFSQSVEGEEQPDVQVTCSMATGDEPVAVVERAR